jgi:hypothetical protein
MMAKPASIRGITPFMLKKRKGAIKPKQSNTSSSSGKLNNWKLLSSGSVFGRLWLRQIQDCQSEL